MKICKTWALSRAGNKRGWRKKIRKNNSNKLQNIPREMNICSALHTHRMMKKKKHKSVITVAFREPLLLMLSNSAFLWRMDIDRYTKIADAGYFASPSNWITFVISVLEQSGIGKKKKRHEHSLFHSVWREFSLVTLPLHRKGRASKPVEYPGGNDKYE